MRLAVDAIMSDQHWTAVDNTYKILLPMYKCMKTADSKQPQGGLLYWQLYNIFSGKAHEEIFKNLPASSPLRGWFEDCAIGREEDLMSDVVLTSFMIDPRYHEERQMIRLSDPMGEWSNLETATARILDKVFHEDIAKHDPSRTVAQLREYREEAFQALTENFIPQTGPFHKDIFKAWASVKDCPNVARWCRSYMGVAPALRMFQMKILSLPLSSSGAERNFSVWKKIWSKDRQAMKFENAEDRVYMYCNQRSNDRAMADLFPAVFLHVVSDKQAPFHASA